MSAGVPRLERAAILIGVAGLTAVAVQTTWSDARQDFVASAPVQVTTSGVSEQRPAVAVGADGSIVVVWDTGNRIEGRRYNSDLTADGSQFLISQRTDSAVQPDVCVDANGDFVTVWRIDSGSDDDIDYRRNIGNSFVGGDTDLHTNSATGIREQPAVDCTDASNFVAVWRGPTGANSDTIVGRRVAAGAPVGSEFQVPTQNEDPREYPDIAMDGSGNFVVAWHQNSQDVDVPRGPVSPFAGTAMRRYQADGTALDVSQVLIEQSDNFFLSKPRVDRAPGGNYVVAWEDSENLDKSVFVRMFDSAGSSLATDELLASGTFSYDMRPVAVFAGPDDTIYVGSNDGADTDTEVQSYSGSLIDGPGFVTDTAANRDHWDMAGTPNGGVVLVWVETDINTDVWARLVLPTLVFSDSFESGNTSAWSAQIPAPPR